MKEAVDSAARTRIDQLRSEFNALRDEARQQHGIERVETLEKTILNLTLRLRKLEDATGYVPKCESCKQELPRG